MILIFAAMTTALAAAALGPPRLGAAALLACLLLSAGLFLFEIHSREDGFAMPWLSTRGEGVVGTAGDAVA
jgi:hypothetical protein